MVDSGSGVGGAPDVAVRPYGLGLWSWVAWHDDRLAPGQDPHLFYQWIGATGYKAFVGDLRLDTVATNRSATNVRIAFQYGIPGYENWNEFAAAWEVERDGAPDSPHDVYARFMTFFGPKNQCFGSNAEFLVSSGSSAARLPAVAASASGNAVFIAWEETEPATNQKIMIAKYDRYGCSLISPTRIDSGDPNTVRHNVALAVDSNNFVRVVWWEGFNNGPETVFQQRLNSNLSPANPFVGPQQLNAPPTSPPGADRALYPSVATDLANNAAFTWLANVNDSNAAVTFTNSIAKSLAPTGEILKNDFRVDLNGRATSVRTTVARSSQPKKFVYAWRDNRSGHMDVYIRAVKSVP